MYQLKLVDALRIMKTINQSKDWNCYFSNGHLVVESKFIIIGEYNEKEVYN